MLDVRTKPRPCSTELNLSITCCWHQWQCVLRCCLPKVCDRHVFSSAWARAPWCTCNRVLYCACRVTVAGSIFFWGGHVQTVSAVCSVKTLVRLCGMGRRREPVPVRNCPCLNGCVAGRGGAGCEDQEQEHESGKSGNYVVRTVQQSSSLRTPNEILCLFVVKRYRNKKILKINYMYPFSSEPLLAESALLTCFKRY